MKAFLMVLFCVMPIFGQTESKPSIYIVAQKIADNKTDLSVEKKLREDFTKQKRYALAPSAATAEIVFLVLTEYDTYAAAAPANGGTVGIMQTYLKSATAIAIPAAIWTQNKGDVEKLKENALWQGDAPGGFYGAHITKLVKKFHEEVKMK